MGRRRPWRLGEAWGSVHLTGGGPEAAAHGQVLTVEKEAWHGARCR
jgi:hypothetical protein